MDPISITVSVLTLAHLCVKSSASLHNAIDGFNSSKRDVQHLKADIGDLNIVLQALEKNIQESTENFEVLRLVLQQCAQACDDFRKAVLEALGEPEDRLQGIKAWVKLQYRGSDIESFRKLIGSYKATMTIALADSNLRTSQATKELLKEYIEMTQITALNLEEQIEELSAKLDLLQSEQHYPSSDIDSIQPTGESTTAKQTLDQKASLEQCLSVCQQLLVHIEEIKPSVFGNTESATGAESTRDLLEDVTVLAPRITANALEICTQNLNATARYLRDLQEGSQSKTKSDEARIMQQLDSAQMCLGIVKDAQQHRTNIFEKIDTAEDSRQIIVSTIGELIKANGLTIGARAINIMGQMNDESLQKIANNFPSTTPERSSSPETGVTFEKRHGFGHTIQRGRR
ncbi:hypothetical protein B0O99DRAFT_581513 [Bisporella sp. PMI_857]|nr:hypothetical protein B0O99DRAFT_581513 [Bisporella sp. PMI_857]